MVVVRVFIIGECGQTAWKRFAVLATLFVIGALWFFGSSQEKRLPHIIMQQPYIVYSIGLFEYLNVL